MTDELSKMEPVGYLQTHTSFGQEISFPDRQYRLTEHDKAAGWSEIPLYALSPAQIDRIRAMEAEREQWREAVRCVVGADLPQYIRTLVSGWNGEGRPGGEHFGRHPVTLGATIPTTCGAVYELDEAVRCLANIVGLGAEARSASPSKSELAEALRQCRNALAMMTEPGAITGSTIMHAYASAVEAVSVADHALANIGEE